MGDIRDILLDGWDLMIAHPPCTHLAVSGARWFTEGKKPIPKQTMLALQAHNWPGNVRELAHAIERAVILSEGERLDISTVVGQVTTIAQPSQIDSAQSENDQLINADTFNLEELEHRTVRAALKHYQGNVSQAAKALGLTRGAMYRRLEKYDL